MGNDCILKHGTSILEEQSTLEECDTCYTGLCSSYYHNMFVHFLVKLQSRSSQVYPSGGRQVRLMQHTHHTLATETAAIQFILSVSNSVKASPLLTENNHQSVVEWKMQQVYITAASSPNKLHHMLCCFCQKGFSAHKRKMNRNTYPWQSSLDSSSYWTHTIWIFPQSSKRII